MMDEARIIRVGKVAGECFCGDNPCIGLDCGPYLPGRTPRKKMEPKPPEEIAAIRSQAWETRREKYGRYGHR